MHALTTAKSIDISTGSVSSITTKNKAEETLNHARAKMIESRSVADKKRVFNTRFKQVGT